MLVAEHDLEKQHLLAVRLKPEMAGLDDSGVHGTDGHFMHFVSANLMKGVRLAIGLLDVTTGRKVIWRMAPQRLEPRVPVGNHAALLGELALECVGLWARRRKRGIAIPDEGARRTQL